MAIDDSTTNEAAEPGDGPAEHVLAASLAYTSEELAAASELVEQAPLIELEGIAPDTDAEVRARLLDAGVRSLVAKGALSVSQDGSELSFLPPHAGILEAFFAPRHALIVEWCGRDWAQQRRYYAHPTLD